MKIQSFIHHTPLSMFSALARSTMPRMAAATKRVRTMATPTRTPPIRADFMKHNWTQDPGTYPIIFVVVFACSVSAYKIFHDIRSPEAHFSKSERTTLDYISNERTEASAENWTSHRTLHKTAQ